MKTLDKLKQFCGILASMKNCDSPLTYDLFGQLIVLFDAVLLRDLPDARPEGLNEDVFEGFLFSRLSVNPKRKKYPRNY